MNNTLAFLNASMSVSFYRWWKEKVNVWKEKVTYTLFLKHKNDFKGSEIVLGIQKWIIWGTGMIFIKPQLHKSFVIKQFHKFLLLFVKKIPAKILSLKA